MGAWNLQPQFLLEDRAPEPLYGYFPKIAPAVVMITMFGISSAIHFVQLVYYRQWWIVILLIGTLAETAGYCM